MKRNALVSVICAVLFAGALAHADEIGALTAKCAEGDRKDCKALEAAVSQLTDQALLAKIAATNDDLDARLTAVKRMTDQAALAQIAVSSKYPVVCDAAIRRVTDQTWLANIAAGDENYVREYAIQNLTDQAQLAKVAQTGVDQHVRWTAVTKLRDRALLAELATARDPLVRARAIASIEEDNPEFGHLTGDLGALTTDAGESIARVRLALEDPLVHRRLPAITLVPRVSELSVAYTGGGAKRAPMQGESVSFVVTQGRKTLAKNSWSTDFPAQTKTRGFVAAEVHGEELLAELLHNEAVTQNDLAEFARSETPEVRYAAVGYMTDRALLARIAAGDKVEKVRQAAQRRLDQIQGKAK
jgi:hypothetical protein